MGQGRWTSSTYDAQTAAKTAAGLDQFAYDQAQRSLPVERRKVHETLDPQLKAGPSSPHAGEVMRECMVTDEHPNPTPIAVFFDQTGSMGQIPRQLQQNLKDLHELLQGDAYCTDPQILFGAIGDARNNERAPLQVGQFESDNTMDENLANIYLEGNGGGQMHETYELGLYFLARHTFLDGFEKQGRKGHAFFIGDERAYPQVSRMNVQDLIGDDVKENLTTKAIVAEVQKRYNLYFLYASQGSYSVESILGEPGTDRLDGDYTWRALLGERAIELEDANQICDVIAGIVGVLEDGVKLEDAPEAAQKVLTPTA